MKKLILTLTLLSLPLLGTFAQEKSSPQLKFEIKEGKDPDVYIDGKKVDYSIVKLLDQSKIKSVNVIKDDNAIQKYNAPNGVILITTKDHTEFEGETKIRIRNKDGNADPIFIINGKVSTKQQMKALKPEDIETIDVKKGDNAIKGYSSVEGVVSSPNGIIIIKTKN